MNIPKTIDSEDDDDALLFQDPNILKIVTQSENKQPSLNTTKNKSLKENNNFIPKTQIKQQNRILSDSINTQKTALKSNINHLNTQFDTQKYPPNSLSSTNNSSCIDSQTETQNMSKRAKFLNEMIQPTFPSSSLTSPKYGRTNSQMFNTQFQDKLNFLRSGSSSRSNSNSPPQSTIPAKNTQQNGFYGLPMRVKELLKELRKISSLYEWQDEILTIMHQKYVTAQANLKNNLFDQDLYTNLLYLSPTSAGKTLVAELIILHCLLIRRKNAIFIMPFVSIVQEKVQLIAEFAEKLNFIVEEYAGVKGKAPPLKRRGKSTLYICTIEKAHSLINSLIETERLADEIGLVVADELHMIGDGPRGAIYEMILSKINYCSEQIILENKKSGNFQNKNEMQPLGSEYNRIKSNNFWKIGITKTSDSSSYLNLN
jgi:ATP-dependent helicase YprA (DUF1998 family)